MNGLIVCWILIVLPVVLLPVAVLRFPWFKRHFGFLARWNRGGFFESFPASKTSTIHGLTMMFILGLVGVLIEHDSSLTKVFAGVFIAQMLIAIPLAVRDYKAHRRRWPKDTEE